MKQLAARELMGSGVILPASPRLVGPAPILFESEQVVWPIIVTYASLTKWRIRHAQGPARDLHCC
jgi:hypothetical protein